MDAEQIRSIDVINGVINAMPGVSDPGDKGLNVTFKMHSHFSDVRTRDEGRPIFEMKEYIMILIPGDTTSSVFRPAFEHDHLRFPEQYLRFKAGQEQAVGTPLTEWTQITRAQVDELAFFRISTVEQLAAVSDSNAQRFMGLNQLRDKASKYLRQLREDAPMLKVEAELKTRDEQIAAQAQQIADMQAMLAKLMEGKEEDASVETPAAPRSTRKSRSQEREEIDA